MTKLDSFLFKSISYNMLLQISFRIVSFVLNVVLFRHVSTDLIGTCNFRLALLYTTTMFLSREPFRRALPNLKQIEVHISLFVNSLWLVVVNGIAVSAFLGYMWLNLFDKPDPNTVAMYDYSIYVCCIACVVELIGEPANSLVQMLFMAKLKVLIEASSLLLFNVTFVVLALYYPQLGAMSYSIARLLNSILFAGSNMYFLYRNRHQLTTNGDFSSFIPMLKSQKFDLKYLKLVKAYFSQSVFKQLLTEGERYLITMFNLLTFTVFLNSKYTYFIYI